MCTRFTRHFPVPCFIPFLWAVSDVRDAGMITAVSQLRKSALCFWLHPKWGKEDNNVLVAAAKSLQSCPTLCNPIDGSPPSSAIPGILQARTLEWVAISFSNAWKWKVKVKSLSHVRPPVTPWTAAYQAPPSMGFSRQGYWSGVPSPSPMSWLKDP